jgi:nucleoside-diphosphate-sugar epimerase
LLLSSASTMSAPETRQLLITGALGWLGSRLVEGLIRGLPDYPELCQSGLKVRVRCLVLPGQDPAPLRKVWDQVEVIVGDIHNEQPLKEACSGGEVVYHCVAQLPLAKDRALFQSVNVGGT